MTVFVTGAYIPIMDTRLSFCELCRKEVINGSDGTRLGHVLDIIFSADDGKVRGIILPYGKGGLLRRAQDLFIPWQCVQKIGEDVILVEVSELASGSPVCKPSPRPELPPDKKPPPRREGDCDGKCEKCMLFECSRRWQELPSGC